MQTSTNGRTEPQAAAGIPAPAQPLVPAEQGGLRARVASEIWNADVREDVVADVKSRMSRGELDLSAESIARAILSGL